MAIEINPSTPSSPIPTVNGISVIWAGEWTSTKIYRRNEGVFHNGSSYRANTSTTQEPSLTATDWDTLAEGGEGAISTSGLNNLTDVTITTPADNNLLAYDSATSNWVNQTAAQTGLITSNDLTSYYTKTEVDSLIPVTPDLTVYYLKSEVDTLLSNKANQSTTYTKTEVNSLIPTLPDLTVYYLKSEVDTLLNAKANQSTTYTKTETDSLLNAKPNNLIQLGDVVITSPTDGQSLVYDDATSKWVNETVSGGGSGEANTASNVGTAGVGLFKQKTGVNLEFKKVNAGSTKISITEDPTNSEIDVDVNEANLTLGNLAGTLPVSKGGTGSTTATNALTALGAASTTTLTSHTTNTSNPHSTTAAQVGAIPTTEKGVANGVATLDSGATIPDSQISNAITRDTELTAGLATKADASNLTSHTTNTSNPHSVTATQVGSATAQWNANKIQGITVHTTAPTNGQVLAYSSANSRYEATTPSAGGGGDYFPGYISNRNYPLLYSATVSGNPSSSIFIFQNSYTYTPFYLPKGATFNQVIFRVTSSAAGNGRVGIYTNNSSTALPDTLVYDSGSISVSTTGDKTITVNWTLSAGLYWLVFASSVDLNLLGVEGNSDYTFLLGNTGSLNSSFVSSFRVNQTFGSLLTTAPTSSRDYQSSLPLIYLRAA